MRRAALFPVAFLLGVTGTASAQPKPKPPTFPVEVISLRSVKFDNSTPSLRLRYERAGNTPHEYRAANNSAFTGASWVPFTESSTRSITSGPTTWIIGFVPSAGSFGVNASCGANTVLQRVFFQFRGKNRSLQTISSNVVSDSLCIPFG